MKNKKILSFFIVMVVVGIIVQNLIFYVKAETTVEPSTSGTTLTGDANYNLLINTGAFNIIRTNGIYTQGEIIKAYKVLDVFYNSSSQNVKYQFTSNFQNFLNQSSEYNNLTIEQYVALNKGDASLNTSGHVIDGFLTSNDYARLMSKYAQYVRTNNISGSTLTGSVYSNSQAIFSATNLSVGTYMALADSNSDYSYGVMVGNIIAEPISERQMKIKDAYIQAKTVNSNMNTTLYWNQSSGTSITVDSDSDITVKVNIVVPTIPADATNFGNAKIKLPMNSAKFTSSLTLKIPTKTGKYEGSPTAETLTDNTGVVIGTSKCTAQGGHCYADGEITLDTAKLVGGSTIELEFKYNLKKMTGSSYTASSQNLSATMEFPEPYGGSMITLNSYASLKSSVIQITGTPGAEFAIKRNGVTVGTIVLSTSVGEFQGLADGAYTLVQTKAPTGYNKLDDATIVVGDDQYAISGKGGYYGVNLVNESIISLPFTGGMGTVIFIVMGVLVVITAIVLGITYKKKKRSVNLEA